MESILVNKVSESSLITVNPEDFAPQEEVIPFDLKDFLFQGMVLKEKDYRLALQKLDWTSFKGKSVAVCCSADAVVPTWAFMLAAIYLQPLAAAVGFGTPEMMREKAFLDRVNSMDPASFRDKRVVVKGCGKLEIPVSVYMEIARLLRPVVKSLMFGEPCSTVPLFKSK